MAPMVIMTAFAAGTSMVAADKQASAINKAGEEAQRLSDLTAADQEAETAEEARRLADQNASDESMAKALAAASGIDVDESSTNLFLEALSTENKTQLDWLKSSGLSQANITRESGASAASTASSQASAAQFGGVASAVGTAGSGYNAWYGKQ